MQYLRRGTQDKQQQHLEDLEEILNTPAPILNQNGNTQFRDSSSRDSLPNVSDSQHQLLSAAQPSDATGEEPAVSRVAVQPVDHQQAPLESEVSSSTLDNQDTSMREKLLAWQSNAYKSAVAPIAAIWSSQPATNQPQAQDPKASWRQVQIQMPNLVEHLASNRGAAVAASVAGAAAGGAIAGPFGVAAGAKTGAFMIAIGAAAAGAAQQYYLQVKPAPPASTS